MEKYIPKSALVAEIESKIEKYTKRGEESVDKRDGYGMSVSNKAQKGE